MSVLNQMLRDLEQRSALPPPAPSAPVAPPLLAAALRSADESRPPLAAGAVGPIAPAHATRAPRGTLPAWVRPTVWSSLLVVVAATGTALHRFEQAHAPRRPVPLGASTYAGALDGAAAAATIAPAADASGAPPQPQTHRAAAGRSAAGGADGAPIARRTPARDAEPAGMKPAVAAAPMELPALAAPPSAASPAAAATGARKAPAASAGDTAPEPVRRSAASLADPQPEVARAGSLIARGRVGEAREVLTAVLTRHPAHADARAALAALQAEAGERAQALATLLEGVANDPARFALPAAQLQNELGAPAAALATLARVPPALRSGAHHALAGAIALSAGEPAIAADAYRRALATADARPVWWIGLGLALEASGEPLAAREALTRAARAAELEPDLRAFARQRLAAIGTPPPTDAPPLAAGGH